jgi:hypothetical protein
MLTSDAIWTNGLGAVLNGLGSDARLSTQTRGRAGAIYTQATSRARTKRSEDLEIIGILKEAVAKSKST